MKVGPVPPVRRLIERRNRAAERRTTSEQQERRSSDRRENVRLTTGILAAPFGAHILGQMEPCPLSAQGVVRAYMKAANS